MTHHCFWGLAPFTTSKRHSKSLSVKNSYIYPQILQRENKRQRGMHSQIHDIVLGKLYRTFENTLIHFYIYIRWVSKMIH